MDFTVRKPMHVFALFGLIIALLVLVVLPLISYLGFFPFVTSVQRETIPESIRSIVELSALLIQLIFLVLGLFIGVPLLWYTLVNNLSVKEMFSRMKLRFEELDTAFLWGLLAVATGFAVIFAIGLSLTLLGFDITDAGNISELELYFSLPSMFILLTVQPVGEEIFFRGFLFDKINYLTGEKTAVFSTALLFGIAHLSYGKMYSAVMTGILGIILGYVVIKTKNLSSAIIAHVLFNVTSFTLFLLSQSLGFEALML
jgi:hypothetical protein